MLLDKHRLITERQQRAWSQTQLAEVSGLSLWTIQRIEKSGKASLESAKALASVYYLQITDYRSSYHKLWWGKPSRKNPTNYSEFLFSQPIGQNYNNNSVYINYTDIFVYVMD